MTNRWHWPFVATEKSLPEKHFGQDVSPDCLRIGTDGTVQVSLAGNWPELLQNLGGFDDLVATTGNESASLTQTGTYPQFKICSCGRSACSSNCGLAFDFSAWQYVWATRRQTKDGVSRALSIGGHDGFTNHQVLFPDEMADADFNQFVKKSSPVPAPEIFGHNLPPRFINPVREPEAAGLLERFRKRKIDFIEDATSRSRLVHPESLAEVWRNVLAERIWLGTTIVTAPIIHSALWQPVSFTENSTALASSSNHFFFRCRLEKISELWVVPLSPESEPAFALEAYDAHNDLLFALAVPSEWKNIWYELLHWLPAV